MTDHEVESRYLDMAENDAPDLWDRISREIDEEKTSEQKGVAEEKNSEHRDEKAADREGERPVKEKGNKIIKFMFGGGTLRTAAAVFVCCLVVISILYAAGNSVRMGSSGSSYNAGSGYSSASSSNSYASYDAGSSGLAAAYEYDEDGYAYEEVAEAEAADQAMDMSSSKVTSSDADVVTDAAAQDETAAQADSDRKRIRKININAETLEFDALIENLKNRTVELGGYVESSSVSGNSYYNSSRRYANMTLRIPKAKTDEFLTTLGDAANITSRSESVEDITLTYVDLESHVKALKAEQEQLMALLDKAETVEEIMTIQSGLTDVRYQLESYSSQLKTYDNKVAYDTINLDISEVTKETPTHELTTWEKMKEGFAQSLIDLGEDARDFAIWFVSSIPYFIAIFVIILVIVFVIKKISGFRKIRKEKKKDSPEKDNA